MIVKSVFVHGPSNQPSPSIQPSPPIQAFPSRVLTSGLLSSRPSVRRAPPSCRIKVVAYETATWGSISGDHDGLPLNAAGLVALPADLADAISDGQLDLFA